MLFNINLFVRIIIYIYIFTAVAAETKDKKEDKKEDKEEEKPAPPAKKAPAAKAPVKPLPQMMEEDVIPSLRATFEAQQDITEIEIFFQDNKVSFPIPFHVHIFVRLQNKSFTSD